MKRVTLFIRENYKGRRSIFNNYMSIKWRWKHEI